MSCRHLIDLLHQQAERLGPRPALRYKRHGLYHDVRWDEYQEAARAGAAALIEAGIEPGDRVGLLSENRYEWLLADMALLTAAAVNLPPHAPLTAAQVEFQLADAGARWLFVSTKAQLDKVMTIRHHLPELRGIVVFDGVAARGDILPWPAFLQRGREALPRLRAELDRRAEKLQGDDLATVMYTSGTTGNPKGVMLTHLNLLSNSLACLAVAPHGEDDLVLNWLPFSHIYARTVDHYAVMAAGVCLCLAESAETVVQNLSDVVPTNLASVPRFYEKVYAAVAAPDPAETQRRLRRVFGPRIDWLSSGGAPLPLEVAKAYFDAGLLLLQGYGLTESSPVISFNARTAYKLDTVGRPVPGVEVRIAPDGEVLTRGPHVMKGYWNNPQATAEAIREDWLYTGDLGTLDADGFLKITGRKKELLVLSNGKKVTPSLIEGLLLAEPCLDQVMVCGDGRNYVTALLVPHWDNVRTALKAQNVELPADEWERARMPAVRELLHRRLEERLQVVSNSERVKRFAVLPRPFSVVEEEMTVSLKLRRGVILDHYAAILDDLYRDGEESED